MLILLFAVKTDLAAHRISNELIFAGFAAGALFWIADISARSGIRLLAGAALPILICWIPFRMHALGAGDVKLLSVVGSLTGCPDILFCISFSFLLAAGISLGRLLSRRQLYSSLNSCFHYFIRIMAEGKIDPYPGRAVPGHCIHVSVAVFLGYLLYLGVGKCHIIPFY